MEMKEKATLSPAPKRDQKRASIAWVRLGDVAAMEG
jgi:hypothetical protein